MHRAPQVLGTSNAARRLHVLCNASAFLVNPPLRKLPSTPAQAFTLRARAGLACTEGVDNKVVASRQRVTPAETANDIVASVEIWFANF